MRERLFHGIRKDNGKWVEGCLLGDDVIVPKGQSFNICHNILDSALTAYEVIPETVGRYTELFDKNRKKIFEGDIVTGQFQSKKISGYIKYGTDGSFYIYRKGLFGVGLNNADAWLTIIGNIYDNPELIGEKTND